MQLIIIRYLTYKFQLSRTQTIVFRNNFIEKKKKTKYLFIRKNIKNTFIFNFSRDF